MRTRVRERGQQNPVCLFGGGLCLVLCLLFFLPLQLSAQSVGTTGAQFLRIKAGPRATAMGGAYTALADDGYGMYWNPAGMSRMQRASFVATHQEQLFEIFNELLGVTYPVDPNNTVGLSSRFVWDEQDVRTELSNKNEFTNYDLSLGLNYANGGRTGFAWGLGLKGIRSRLAGFNATTFALDGGIHYQSPRTPLKLGAVVQNIGPDLKFIEEGDPLPRTFRFGWAYDFHPFRKRLTLSNDLVYFEPEKQTSLNVGAEFKPYEFIALRAGYFTPEGFQEDGEFSAGLGVRYGDVDLDYAYSSRESFSNQHRFSMSFHFGARPEQDYSKEDPYPVDRPSTEREQQWERDLEEEVPETPSVPSSVEGINLKAEIYFEAQEYERALELWKKSLAKEPIQRDVFRKMAIAYYEIGEYDLARQYMKDASRGVDSDDS